MNHSLTYLLDSWQKQLDWTDFAATTYNFFIDRVLGLKNTQIFKTVSNAYAYFWGVQNLENTLI